MGAERCWKPKTYRRCGNLAGGWWARQDSNIRNPKAQVSCGFSAVLGTAIVPRSCTTFHPGAGCGMAAEVVTRDLGYDCVDPARALAD